LERRLCFRQINAPNHKPDRNGNEVTTDAATGEVVLTVREVVAGLELPVAICAGLNEQVVSAGRFEHEKVRGDGKEPSFEVTVTASGTELPAATEAVFGASTQKSNAGG
jgi:hypothetical protein